MCCGVYTYVYTAYYIICRIMDTILYVCKHVCLYSPGMNIVSSFEKLLICRELLAATTKV